MRIAMVVSSFEGLFINSGIGTFYATLADFLVRKGHTVTVVYTREQAAESQTSSYWVAYYQSIGIELIAIPPFQNPRVDTSYFLKKSYQVYSYLTSRQFDMIHFPDWEGVGY